MLHTVKPTAWMAIFLICFTGMAGIAWQTNPVTTYHSSPGQDTTPKKEKEQETIINGDLDKAMEQVKRAQENLEIQLQQKNQQKINEHLEQSLENFDAENIHAQLAKAMKDIDFQKIQLQAQATLKQVDWAKMQEGMQKAMAEMKTNIDEGKMQEDMQKAMAQTRKALAKLKAVDMKKMQLDLEKSRQGLAMNEHRIQEELERAKKDLRSNFPKDFSKELQKAKEGINRAAEELQNYKEMLDEMERDGLLRAGEPYDIEYKKGDLLINGKQQAAGVTGKYKHYFKKENVRIKRGKDDEDNRTIYL